MLLKQFNLILNTIRIFLIIKSILTNNGIKWSRDNSCLCKSMMVQNDFLGNSKGELALKKHT